MEKWSYQVGGGNDSLAYLLQAKQLTCCYDAWGRKLWNMSGILAAQQVIWSPLLSSACVLLLASEKPMPAASLSLSWWEERGGHMTTKDPPHTKQVADKLFLVFFFYISSIQEHTLAFNYSLAIPPLTLQLSHFKGRSWISNKNKNT